jgi:hypothetical protein
MYPLSGEFQVILRVPETRGDFIRVIARWEGCRHGFHSSDFLLGGDGKANSTFSKGLLFGRSEVIYRVREEVVRKILRKGHLGVIWSIPGTKALFVEECRYGRSAETVTWWPAGMSLEGVSGQRTSRNFQAWRRRATSDIVNMA